MDAAAPSSLYIYNQQHPATINRHTRINYGDPEITQPCQPYLYIYRDTLKLKLPPSPCRDPRTRSLWDRRAEVSEIELLEQPYRDYCIPTATSEATSTTPHPRQQRHTNHEQRCKAAQARPLQRLLYINIGQRSNSQ